MKKLMTLMLGMSLALGCVSVTFAQDTPPRKKRRPRRPPRKRRTPPRRAHSPSGSNPPDCASNAIRLNSPHFPLCKVSCSVSPATCGAPRESPSSTRLPPRIRPARRSDNALPDTRATAQWSACIAEAAIQVAAFNGSGQLSRISISARHRKKQQETNACPLGKLYVPGSG